MSIRITRFHKFEKGHLYGFLDVAVPVWGTVMNIKGCKVFLKEGRQWITLPSREYTDSEGNVKYQSLIGIEDETIYKQFQKGLHDAWHEYCKAQQPSVQEERPDGVPF